ncbi:MAG TPA: MerR family transcriptional regulator [Woeseiaceae bacterium]|nr:MerR family transcriptional regulator [Woeseiaceae bacterium]
MDLTIGKAAIESGFTPDTLRYYERIRLMPPPGRTSGRQRIYRERDLARLRFIRRAQAVGFSLDEIRKLLRFRENPARSGRAVRKLAAIKHEQLKDQLETLHAIEGELALLLSLCRGLPGGCPILEELDTDDSMSKTRREMVRGREARRC